MVGACQRGPSCPYSHDRTISRKGTLPCRFFQVGTCANGTECRFSHDPSPGSSKPDVPSLTIQMDSFTFDQSEVGSEGSYESYEGYPVLMDPSGSGYTLEPVYEASGGYYDGEQQQAAAGYWSQYTSLSPQVVVTVLPAPAQPSCDHPKSDQSHPEANNSIESQESSTVSSVSPTSPSTSCDTRDHDPPVLVPLTKTRPQKAEASWNLEAAEFVPSVGGSEGGEARPKSWAQVVNTGLSYPGMELSISQAESLLCPFYKVGECRSVQSKYVVNLVLKCLRQMLLSPTLLLNLLSDVTGMAWAAPTSTGTSATTAARPASTPPTWTRGGRTWPSVCRSTSGTWSSASRWPRAGRRPAASAWRSSSTSPRGRPGQSSTVRGH